MENKIIYQVYPKSFKDTNNDGIGDIQGIIEKFDYIKKLNIDYLWLTPVMKSPQNDNGYDISDYYQIDPIFGTLEDYQQLINLCNEHQIGVMLDLVLNHISTEHEWFKRAINGEQKYQDYFIWTDTPNELQSGFGTNAWSYCEQVGKYYLHLFDETQVDLNWHNKEVRDEIYNMVNFWIDLGVKGFRLDVIDLIAKEPEKMITSRGPKFKQYLQELTRHTFKNDVLTVGECWNFGPEDTKIITSDDGLTQVFHFSHLNWIYPKWGADRITTSALANIMNKWQNADGIIEALVLNNHDLPRLQSYWYGPFKNHDDNYLKTTMLFSLNLLSRGNTYIYQGEEIGMVNGANLTIDDYDDIEIRNKVAELRANGTDEVEILKLMQKVGRDNARLPMKWNQSTNNFGFSEHQPWLMQDDSQVCVENDLTNTNSIYRKYIEMITWKQNNYSYNNSYYYAEEIENDVLKIENDKFIMIINLSDKVVENHKLDKTIELSNYSAPSPQLREYEFVCYQK